MQNMTTRTLWMHINWQNDALRVIWKKKRKQKLHQRKQFRQPGAGRKLSIYLIFVKPCAIGLLIFGLHCIEGATSKKDVQSVVQISYQKWLPEQEKPMLKAKDIL